MTPDQKTATTYVVIGAAALAVIYLGKKLLYSTAVNILNTVGETGTDLGKLMSGQIVEPETELGGALIKTGSGLLDFLTFGTISKINTAYDNYIQGGSAAPTQAELNAAKIAREKKLSEDAKHASAIGFDISFDNLGKLLKTDL